MKKTRLLNSTGDGKLDMEIRELCEEFVLVIQDYAETEDGFSDREESIVLSALTNVIANCITTFAGTKDHRLALLVSFCKAVSGVTQSIHERQEAEEEDSCPS